MESIYHEFALLLIGVGRYRAIAVRLRQPFWWPTLWSASWSARRCSAGSARMTDRPAGADRHHRAAVRGGAETRSKHIRHIGPVALATGLGQLGFTIVFDFSSSSRLARAGWKRCTCGCAGFLQHNHHRQVALDKRELDSLHGRIAVGFLIVQDLAVVVAMMVMSGSAAWRRRDQRQHAGTDPAGALGGAALLLYVLMRYVLPRIVDTLARSQELLLIFAIAWGTALAALGETAGFSKEPAPSSPASRSPQRRTRGDQRAACKHPRFPAAVFFIDLGSKLDFSTSATKSAPPSCCRCSC